MRKFLFAVIVVFLSGFLYFSYMFSVEDFNDKKDAEDAARNVLSIYLKDGMVGLITLSQECYENDEISKHHCLLIDVASGLWDKMVASAMRFPLEEYFDDEVVIKRIIENDGSKRFTFENIRTYMNVASEIAKERLVIEMDLQKHKLEDGN